jgi:opacity protein-like surface antigen
MRSAFASLTLMAAAGIAPQVAAAEYDATYLGLRGSYVATESASTVGSIDFDFNQDYASGDFAIAAYFGWVLDGDFRMELEGAYRNSVLDEVTILRDQLTVPEYTAGQVVPVGGEAQAVSAMVNLFYDIHLFEGPILPWIGAGFGGAHIDYSILDPNADATFDSSDDDWAFAYQFMAGITFPVAEGVSMSAGYRFFQTQNFSFVSTTNERFETDLTQHSFDLGLQLHL